MTTQEFSNEFDILYNNIMSNQAPGLDEYEKSVLLTKAQEDIIIQLYSGKNPFGDSFEKTEEVRRYLNNLIKTYKTSETVIANHGLSDTSKFFKLPKDLLFITYEQLITTEVYKGTATELLVVPTTQDEYFSIVNNPFKGPNPKRALRINSDNELVEIITNYKIDTYTIRYLAKPSPIVLIDLLEDLTVDGIGVQTECSLSPITHRAILDRAVNLAFYLSNRTNKNIEN